MSLSRIAVFTSALPPGDDDEKDDEAGLVRFPYDGLYGSFLR